MSVILGFMPHLDVVLPLCDETILNDMKLPLPDLKVMRYKCTALKTHGKIFNLFLQGTQGRQPVLLKQGTNPCDVMVCWQCTTFTLGSTFK